jgi:hypothetical protein
MKKLPAVVLFAGMAQAPLTPIAFSAPHLGSATSAAPTATGVGSVNVHAYLAACSGSPTVNVCATKAANQAKAGGLALYFPAGLYPLSAWSPLVLWLLSERVGAKRFFSARSALPEA